MWQNRIIKIKSIIAVPVWIVLIVLNFSLLVAQPAQKKDIPIPKDSFIAEFSDIDIRDFIKTMAQITKRNILIDDTIQGKITVKSYKPIPVNRAMDFMRQVLDSRGYAVIEEPNLVKVVPQERGSAVVMPEKKDPTSASTGLVSKVIKFPAGANLTEISNLLKSIADKNINVTVFRPGNSIVITGYAQVIRKAMDILQQTVPDLDKKDSGDTSNSEVHIYNVKFMNAEKLADLLSKVDLPVSLAALDPAHAAIRAAGGRIKAVAHKESNSIVVSAGASDWEEIKKIIKELDRERKQMLLEVLVAEVSSSNINDFGIDWRYQGTNAAHTQFNTGLAVEGNLVDPSTGSISGNNTLSGFSLGFLRKGGDLLAIFNANVKNQNFNVLSAPQILTVDNQEAEINVGQDVPVRTQERTSGGGTSETTINSFEYRPSGIKLKFTPHINSLGQISVELFSEVTNIEGNLGTSGSSNPVFSKRNIKTNIQMDDKQTVVIGGLVSNEKFHDVKKIPILGDIPLLGYFFRRNILSDKKTNLMVFITPHILNSRADADKLSSYKRREQIQSSRKRQDEIILWPDTTPSHDRKDDIEEIENED